MNTQRAPTDEPLSGQQLQAMQQRWNEALQRVVDHVALRKLCLEMAVKAACTTADNPDVVPDVVYADVVALARGMYAFLTEPAQEVRVVIEQESL